MVNNNNNGTPAQNFINSWNVAGGILQQALLNLPQAPAPAGPAQVAAHGAGHAPPVQAAAAQPLTAQPNQAAGSTNANAANAAAAAVSPTLAADARYQAVMDKQPQLLGHRRYWDDEQHRPPGVNLNCATNCKRKKPEKIGCSTIEPGGSRQCRNWVHSHVMCCNAPAQTWLHNTVVKWSCELASKPMRHDFGPPAASGGGGGAGSSSGGGAGAGSAPGGNKARGDARDKGKGRADARDKGKGRDKDDGGGKGKGKGKAGASSTTASTSKQTETAAAAPTQPDRYCDSPVCIAKDVPLQGSDGEPSFLRIPCKAIGGALYGPPCRHQVHAQEECSNATQFEKGWWCQRVGLKHDFRTDEEVAAGVARKEGDVEGEREGGGAVSENEDPDSEDDEDVDSNEDKDEEDEDGNEDKDEDDWDIVDKPNSSQQNQGKGKASATSSTKAHRAEPKATSADKETAASRRATEPKAPKPVPPPRKPSSMSRSTRSTAAAAAIVAAAAEAEAEADSETSPASSKRATPEPDPEPTGDAEHGTAAKKRKTGKEDGANVKTADGGGGRVGGESSAAPAEKGE